jgi:tetratricopeptide (TPR) repeat protein
MGSDEPDDPPSDELGAMPGDTTAERWPRLALQARYSRLSRELFDVEVAPPRVGRFELETLRGAGAMGVVFGAYDPQLDRRVAVKLLTIPDLAVRAGYLLDEAKALARLSHPNVVAVHEVGLDEGDLFVVMELVDGSPLSEHWLEHTPSVERILDAFVQAGEGLAAVHEAGIVHCDFKPGNVLIDRDARVKVADFGLARLADDVTSTGGGSRSSEPGEGASSAGPRGTPAYMAPEQLAGARPDARSDQYGFCVSLWEALHGCRPFTHAASAQSVSASLEPRRARPVPGWLDRALVRGLTIDPAARWPTMADLVGVLRDTPQRRRTRLGAGAFMIALAVAVGAGRLLNQGPTCPEIHDELDAVWSAERRDAMASTWHAGPAFATASWPAVRDELDRWAEDWLEVRQQACLATFEAHTRSDAAFDRTMACLDRRRNALGSATELLGTGKPEIVAAAGPLLHALDHPSTCLDDTTSERAVRASTTAEPEGIAAARQVDRARLLVASGDPLGAIAELAVDPPATLAGTPIIAEHQLVRGRALAILGRSDVALDALSRAAHAALRVEDDTIAADVFLELAELDTDLQQYEDARRWLELADAELQRVVAEPRRWARFHDVTGLLALRRSEPKQAETSHREALQLLVSGAADDPLALTIRRHLAVSLAEQGHFAAAKAIYDALAAEITAELGDAHPDLGTIERNLAIDARARRDLYIALAHAERGHHLLVGAFGKDSVRVAPTLTLLADLWSDLGVHDKAATLAADAWRLQREHLPLGHSERASALAVLAWIQLHSEDLAAALASNIELEREFQHGPNHAQLPTISYDIGYCLCALGRCAEAYERFTALRNQLPEGDPLVPYAASGLALSELERSHREIAEVIASETLERVLEQGIDDSDLRGELRLILAACRLTEGDRVNAEVHARSAGTDQPSPAVRRLFRAEVIAMLDAVQPSSP